MPRVARARRSVTEIAAEVVCSYVASNAVPASQLPSMLCDIYAALQGLSGGRQHVPSESDGDRPTPAEIRKSVRPDALISFIDGRPYKILKRHLAAHGLDPQSYRTRFGLGEDYPMVAPNYAAHRSVLAKAIGLGLPHTAGRSSPASTRGGAAATPTDRGAKTRN